MIIITICMLCRLKIRSIAVILFLFNISLSKITLADLEVRVTTNDQGYRDVRVNNSILQTPKINNLAQDNISFSNLHIDSTCVSTRIAYLSGTFSLRA